MKDDTLAVLSTLTKIDREKLDKIYSILEIYILSQIKTRITLWFGSWVIVITLIVALLAFFGFDAFLHNQVGREVTEALKSEKKILSQARIDAVTAQVSANSIIAATNAELDTLSKLSEEIDKNSENYRQFLDTLSKIMENEDSALAFKNLINEFYVLKSLEVFLDIRFSKQIKELTNGESARTLRISQVDLQNADDVNSSVAQFKADEEDITTIGDYRLAYRLVMYSKYRAMLYGRPINEFTIGSLRLRRSFQHQAGVDGFISAYQSFESAHYHIIINGVPVVKETIGELKFESAPTRNRPFRVAALHDLGDQLTDVHSAFIEAISSP